MTRAEIIGIVAVSLGLAAAGLWRAWPSGADGHERVARRPAPAAVESPEAADQEEEPAAPAAPPSAPPRAMAAPVLRGCAW